MRLSALILSVLLLSVLLTGCGTVSQESPPSPDELQPEETQEPLLGYTVSVLPIEGSRGECIAVCTYNGGFCFAAEERTGEEIPEAVVREAKRRNREPYNDGRYDVYTMVLTTIGKDGDYSSLEDYTPLPMEEIPDGWRGFSCETGIRALAQGENRTLLSLEYNTVSANSAPARRADVVPGKNYREYHTFWYLRTLDETGKEIACTAFEGDEEAALAAMQAKTREKKSSLFETGEVPFIWEELGLRPDSVLSRIQKLDEGSFLFLIEREGKRCLATVSYGPVESKKTELLLAADEAVPALLEAAAAFNEASDDLFIRVTDYETAASGAGADLFCMEWKEMRTMAKSGKLEDLYMYLDSDAELKRSDFFPNILKALEVDGGLYCSCAGVSFETVIGASSMVGEKAGWNYDSFLQAWSDFGIGTDAFDVFTTSSSVLRACLSMDLDRFIDDDGQTCHFTDEAFTKLLYFTGNFPRSFTYADRVLLPGDASDLRIRQGKQLLLEREVCGFDDMLICGCEFPEEITFIGYPTLSGAGNIMTISTFSPGLNLGISASSELKEEAWRFVRTFFSEEYQMDYWYFPVNVNAFNRKLTDAMAVTYVLDEKGNVTYDRITKEPVIQSIDTMYLSNYTPVSIYPLTEEKAEKLVDLMSSSSRIHSDNSDICTVVEKAVFGFYTGDLTLHEAAEAAQREVEEYLAHSSSNETE